MAVERKPKVFCVGWHKTGTSTLGLALLELGYSVVGARLDLEEPLKKGDIATVIELAGQFDATQDVPWAVLFRELDAAYPRARFVLTDRDDKKWLRSAINHFGDADIPMHRWIYGIGSCIGNEELYLERYKRHRKEVRAWFVDRPHDLLEMNFEEGDDWAKLCAFLDHPIPRKPWPHMNKGRHNRGFWEKLLDNLKRIAPMSLRRRVFAIRLRIRARAGLPDPRNKFNNVEENRRARRNSL